MNNILFDKIHTITEFKEFISKENNINELRKELYERFMKFRHYTNALEWNELVKTCELLSIVGWGDKEHVDAKSRFNGDCWETRLNNTKNETRFRQGRWKKRKNGWILFNPEYHYSPDFPEEESQGWKLLAEGSFDLVDVERLNSQRNYKKLNPFIIGIVRGQNETSKIITQFKRELTEEFNISLRPENYNEHIEFIYFSIKCPFRDLNISTHFKDGRLNIKSKSYSCDASFDLKFSNLGKEEQKEIFSSFILNAIERSNDKLKKKNLGDNQKLLNDTTSIIELWKNI